MHTQQAGDVPTTGVKLATKGFIQPHPQEKIFDKVTQAEMSLEELNQSQIKELMLKLDEKGFTLDYILSKYKELSDTKPKEVKASDILKVLERVEELRGLNAKRQDEVKIRTLTQHKSSSELTTTLTEITMNTQRYLDKLAQRKLQDEVEANNE